MPVSLGNPPPHPQLPCLASGRLLDATGQITPDELTRDFKTSDKNVLEMLTHVFAADSIWLARVRGESPTTFLAPEDRHPGVLSQQWPAIQQRWKEWAAPLTGEDVQAKISYRDMKGNPWEQPLWQILLHVVNHGTRSAE